MTPDPDWDNATEAGILAAAFCDGVLIDRDTKVPCQLPPDHPGHPHEAEFFGAIYRWDTPDGDYEVATILADEWKVVHRA